MDLQELERIVTEEVRKALGERQRAEDTALPPDPNLTLDAGACRGPACSMPSPVPAPTAMPAVQPNAITDAITKVLGSTGIQPAAPKPSSPIPSPSGPAILLIFTGAREKWDVLSAAFRAWREQGIQLDAIFSSSSQYVISSDEIAALGIRTVDRLDEVRELLYDVSRYTTVFLPSISRTHAAKLALGITDTLTLNMTLSALAQKAKVVASSDGLDPTACVVCGNQVPGIQDILDNYRGQLGKMGLKLMPAEDAVKDIFRVALNKSESGPELVTSLVTEEDAAKLKGPVIRASRGGLITPLAMELLNKRGIEVVIVPQS